MGAVSQWSRARGLHPGAALAVLAALFAISAWVALALLPSRGGGSAAGAGGVPVTLRYMLWDANQRPLYQQCADDFQQRHPGLRIRIQQQGWDDYWTTLSTGFVAETAPDVFTNHLSKYADLVANGLLEDLAPWIDRDGPLESSYVPGLYPMWGRNGHQYGLPKDWDTVALAVNLDLARAAGLGDAELRSLDWNPRDGGSFGRAIARLTRDAAGRSALDAGFDKASVKVFGYQNPGAGGMSGQTEWSPFAVSNGFRYQDQPGDPALHYDDPRLAETLTWLAALPRRGLSASPQALGKLGVDALFVSGRVAMVPAGAWMVGHYARSVRFAYAWVPLPAGPSGARTSMLNGLADSIWVGSRHKAEAWAWVRYLASADCQKRLAEAGAVFPALRGLEEQTLAAHRRLGIDTRAFVEMAHAGSFAPPIAENAAEINQIVGAAMEDILLGRAEAGPALKTANALARGLAGR